MYVFMAAILPELRIVPVSSKGSIYCYLKRMRKGHRVGGIDGEREGWRLMYLTNSVGQFLRWKEPQCSHFTDEDTDAQEALVTYQGHTDSQCQSLDPPHVT